MSNAWEAYWSAFNTGTLTKPGGTVGKGVAVESRFTTGVAVGSVTTGVAVGSGVLVGEKACVG